MIPKERKARREPLKHVVWSKDSYDAAKGSELIVLLTEWNEFRALDLKKLSSVMKDARMADLEIYIQKKKL